MYKLLVAIFSINFVILINGCASGPPKPVLPDGSHRVPVNRVPPVPDVPDVPATRNLPASPDAGDRS
jgi:hypothetical protein